MATSRRTRISTSLTDVTAVRLSLRLRRRLAPSGRDRDASGARSRPQVPRVHRRRAVASARGRGRCPRLRRLPRRTRGSDRSPAHRLETMGGAQVPPRGLRPHQDRSRRPLSRQHRQTPRLDDPLRLTPRASPDIVVDAGRTSELSLHNSGPLRWTGWAGSDRVGVGSGSHRWNGPPSSSWRVGSALRASWHSI